ncbi:MAG: hypothetical protein WC401_05380 [Bacteroidales bacterium]
MEAKKTFYNNYYFRSKLEAKWAVFFDKCFIKYVYEPESYMSLSGQQYTPDFYLPEAVLRTGYEFDDRLHELIKMGPGVYIEIKPLGYTCDDGYKKRISEAINPSPLILLVGDPVSAINHNQKFNTNTNENEQLSPYWDNCMVLMYCKNCGKVKFEFDEGNYYICNKCGEDISGSELNKQAIEARNFRFQFYNVNNK